MAEFFIDRVDNRLGKAMWKKGKMGFEEYNEKCWVQKVFQIMDRDALVTEI